MNRVAKPQSLSAWHAGFLTMLPAIVTHARVAFRCLDPDAKAEAVQEVVANAFVAFARLVQLGKIDIAYATPLARYAVAQVRDGRRVGGHLKIQDVSSAHCQRQKKVTMEWLDHFDKEENAWKEAVVVDTRSAPVPDIVAFRCDFADWLHRLPRRNRRIAQFLAVGNRTGETARKFGVCEGRVSQVRKELAESWRAFVGEEPDARTAGLATA